MMSLRVISTFCRDCIEKPHNYKFSCFRYTKSYDFYYSEQSMWTNPIMMRFLVVHALLCRNDKKIKIKLG